MKLKQAKEAIRTGYAWPGGYELFGIADDGNLLCCKCMRDNFRAIVDSTKHSIHDGWCIDAIGSSADLESGDWIREEGEEKGYSLDHCVHCNKEMNQ